MRFIVFYSIYCLFYSDPAFIVPLVSNKGSKESQWPVVPPRNRHHSRCRPNCRRQLRLSPESSGLWRNSWERNVVVCLLLLNRARFRIEAQQLLVGTIQELDVLYLESGVRKLRYFPWISKRRQRFALVIRLAFKVRSRHILAL